MVSAEDVSSDIHVEDSLDTDVVVTNAEIKGNFTWLDGEIKESGVADAFIDLEGGIVRWNDTGKFKEGILINKNVIIKNGLIDGMDSVRIFHINPSGNLLLENVTIQNGYGVLTGGAIFNEGMLTIDNSNLTNNNVIIENVSVEESHKGGGVIFNKGKLYITNSIFSYNDAHDTYGGRGASSIVSGGGAIYNNEGSVWISDCLFAFNTANNFGGAVVNWKGKIFVNNSLFINGSSKYSAAIFNAMGQLEVTNSDFINLNAIETAGAIGFKTVGVTRIINSNFLNISSGKNGGAIFADNQEGNVHLNELYIYDSNFINCSSDFGGAIVFLNGYLIINNSSFEDNSAFYNGGAVYASWAFVNISKSNFTSNKGLYDEEDYQSEGGALFLDCSISTVSESIFIDNSAMYGGAIYAYDTDQLLLNKNIFNDNQAKYGSALYTEFDENITLIENIFNNDTVSINNTHYVSFFDSYGVNIVFVNNSIIVSNFPSKFDLRDFGWITPVANQGFSGACWTFGTSSALESALLKATGIEYSFSQSNMQNTMLQYSKYGIKIHEGGAIYTGVNYLVSWLGGLSIEYESFDEIGKISPLYYNEIQVLDAIIIFPDSFNNSTDFVDAVKDTLIKYGAVELSYSGGKAGTNHTHYFNKATNAQYSPINFRADHSVSIVGWDDNFSKDKFLITPPGDGAFIVKNNYGTDWGDGGYFYLSYYDNTIEKIVGFIFTNDVSYNKNYQYDLSGEIVYTSDYTIYANQFVSKGDDLIAAVGTYFDSAGVDYKLDIYVNDVFVYSQNGVSPFSGYHTIQLNEYIPIKTGDVFKVVMESDKVPLSILSRVHSQVNTSFVSADGITWEDSYNKLFKVIYEEKLLNSTAIVSLKVYTVG
ncbi:lectin like domain-containing protein, partial [Methanobrevibacter sp. OttesenSCG-928-I08]|nr:lectin like domain-containing protein [Methanobrevibacter sp. OttesenSCG-928-I08]